MLLRILFLAVSLFLATAAVVLPNGPAQAQQPIAGPDYEAWEKTATRAENAMEAGRASTSALEAVRNELRDWRQKFSDAQDANSKTIATVVGQLKALGPEPEDGSEAADITSQRNELNRRLARLQAPVKTAELAQSRADGLIKGIDQIVRTRQTNSLLAYGPSPLNPAHWGEGVNALFDTFSTIQNEFETAWNNPVQRSETNEKLPAAILLFVLGIVLLTQGRRWSERLSRRILSKKIGPARWLISFFVSLGEMFLPFAGMLLLISAIYATGLVGLRSDFFLAELLPATFIFLLSRWLALRIFPIHDTRASLLNLDKPSRREGRICGVALGLVVAAFYLLKNLAEVGEWSEAASNVVLFPVMLAASVVLMRLANLLLAHSRAGPDEGDEENFRDKITRFLARAMLALAVIAPVLAAIGYFRAAQTLMLPSLMSLLLMAALMVMQRLVTEVYILLSGNREGAGDSLVPALISLLIVLLSMPVFALIWGARVADLTDLWTKFTEGVYVGDTLISPKVFLILAIVFLVGYLNTRLIQGVLKNTVLPKTKMDAGGRNAVVSGVGYVGIFLAALIAINSAGIDLSSLALVAGALSVGIGFGLQNIVSNFVSGIILLIERPISEGDWIEVGGNMGYVRAISVRSTLIETFDRSDVIVPNADLVSGPVTNYTRGSTVGRVIVPVGVAYGSDTKRVEAILDEIANGHPMVLANPAPSIVFKAFSESSLDFEIRAILRDVNWMLSVHSDMNHEIAQRFAKEGIQMPFAQRDIWIRNPGPLNISQETAAPNRQKSERAVTMNEADMDGEGDGDT